MPESGSHFTITVLSFCGCWFTHNLVTIGTNDLVKKIHLRTWKKILSKPFNITYANAKQTFHKLGKGEACRSKFELYGACVLEE